MELLEGQNLAEVLRARGQIPWRRVIGWAARAAAALDTIHAAGVVHLDLKPANLFLCEGGALKVLDFGIARRAGVSSVLPRRGERLPPAISAREAEVATGLFVAERPISAGSPASHSDEAFAATRPVPTPDPTMVDPRSRSSPRVVIGTPGFMAPEVLELCEPTAAADAYALAVCVVQLVSGHLPVAAPDEPATWDDPTAVSTWLDAIRSATVRGELRPLDAGSMGLPRGVAALLKRLLAVDPAARAVTPGQLGALFDEAWERPHGVPDPPYFGLASYPPEGEGLLFGRDDDIARLGRELCLEPAIVLQGPAGAGKSSLALAGLVPYLGRNEVDGKDDWIAALLGAGVPPDTALAAALERVSPTLAGAGLAEIVAHCEASPIGVAIVLDPLHAAAAGPGNERLAALVDAVASGGPRPGLRLIGAVREESVAALLSTPIGKSLRGAVRFIGGPAMAAVKDIVAAPAHFAGVAVFGVDRLAADVHRELRGGAGRLPYVAMALADLWPALARGAAGAADVEAWSAQGGVRGAVIRHAQRCFASLSHEDRDVALEILLRLSTTDAHPLRWDRDELCAAASPEHGARVLERLRAVHLVSVAHDGVEIGHEALLTGFPPLASARLSQMDRLAFLERLREARQAWDRAEHHRDLLLHGELLDEAQRRGADSLPPADRAFVDQSRRRARLRRALRWSVASLLLLLAGGGVWGQEMVDEARDAEARARAANEELAQLAELSARARRTEDPYQRVAFAAAAMERGSADGTLPLEIAASAANVARATFLTLDNISGPSFPWDDRFLLGAASGSSIALFDFRPSEPDVIEDVDLDFDPDASDTLHFKMPALRRFRPHRAAVVERAAFAFDTAFATRASDGEVKVFRVRDDGAPVLAAVAPIRCASPLSIAAAAPVLACGVERGIARWDLRRAAEVETHPFAGAVLDVSADGARVAAATEKELLLWEPASAREVRRSLPRPVTVARWSPRDATLAVADPRDLLVLGTSTGEPLFSAYVGDLAPEQLRWDEGGLDLAACGPRLGRWIYLKHGGRALTDAPPRGAPCTPPRTRGQPEPIRSAADHAELGDLTLGDHPLAGGFRLRGRRFLSRDLVVFDGPPALPSADGKPGGIPAAAARLLRFDGRDELGGEEPPDPGASVAAVERDDDVVLYQVRDEIRVHALRDGSRLATRTGAFVRRCLDGRWLSYRAAGERYAFSDARSGGSMGEIPRTPGIVLGADAACTRLYTERLDGTLVATPLAGGPDRELGRADGYVHLSRPVPARGGVASGLLLAFGSGAVARIDDASGAVRVLAYATPRARALAEGPRPGDVIFADSGGVQLAAAGASTVRLAEPGGAWEDLSAAPEGATILLLSQTRVAVLDVARREIVGSMPLAGRDRLSRWDDEGSVLAWSFTRRGPSDGVVIPRGVSLARAVSASISNLAVEKSRIVIRR
jgi:hypothetical protein